MISSGADRSSGYTGIAWADAAISPRPAANADATSSFMDFPFLLNLPRRGSFTLTQKTRRSGTATRALPVAAMPAPVTAMAVPAPMSAAPVPVPVMAPAHLLGLDTVNLVFGGDSGTDILREQPAASFQRMRRKWCGLRAHCQRGGAGGKSSSEFQKVAAFHDISSWCMASDAGQILVASR
jgi:hypothetical protein